MGVFSWLFGNDSKSDKPGRNRPRKKGKRNKNLKDKLQVGMTYKELVGVLGEPTCSTDGAILLEGPAVFAMSDDAKAKIARTVYYKWSRPEGDYDLVVLDGRLSMVQSVPK